MTHGIKSLLSVRAFVRLAIAGSLLPPYLAMAQESAGQEAAQIDFQVEIITVTARLREENLQDAPLSAHVVSDRIGEQNITSLSELSQLVSGVKFQPTGRSNEQYIRGIGSGNNASFNQSVSTFIDGVYHGRSRTSGGTSLLDFERVEILKGPQSTYFGNNAIAGAVNLVSRKPGEPFNTSVRGLYGENGQYAFESAVGGRLSNTLSARAAVLVNGQDGYLRNVADGSDSPNEDNKAARVSLLYQPNSMFDATFKVEGSKYNQTGGLVQQAEFCPPDARFATTGFCTLLLNSGGPIGVDNDQNAFPPGQNTQLDTAEGVMTLNYRMSENATITSITGYYTYDYDLQVAGNPTPVAMITATVPEEFDQISQELRIASPLGGDFEYLAGVYFLDEQLDATQNTNFFLATPNVTTNPMFAAIAPFVPIGQTIVADVPAKTYSVFGSAGFRVFDAWKLSAGLRATSVEKDIDQSVFFGTATQTYAGVVNTFPDPNLQAIANGLNFGIAGSRSASRTDDAVMPSAQVQYNLSETAMSYASFTRGFKAGGFNVVDTTGVQANLPYDPEYVNAYEIGLKSQWMDGALSINTAVFRGEYEDLQVVSNSFGQNGAIISTVQNAASAISQGVELETRWRVTENFRLGLEMTYLDAYYESYMNAGGTQAQQRLGIRIQDLSGQPTALAPEWSGSLVGAYTQPLGWAAFTTEVSVFGSTDYFLGGSGVNDDLLKQAGYGRLDARLSLSSGRWTAELIGKNLTDRAIRLAGSAVPGTLGTVIVSREQPRALLGQVRFSFN